MRTSIWQPLINIKSVFHLLNETTSVVRNFLGVLWVINAKITLGRSFGWLPANRGVVAVGVCPARAAPYLLRIPGYPRWLPLGKFSFYKMLQSLRPSMWPSCTVYFRKKIPHEANHYPSYAELRTLPADLRGILKSGLCGSLSTLTGRGVTSVRGAFDMSQGKKFGAEIWLRGLVSRDFVQIFSRWLSWPSVFCSSGRPDKYSIFQSIFRCKLP